MSKKVLDLVDRLIGAGLIDAAEYVDDIAAIRERLLVAASAAELGVPRVALSDVEAMVAALAEVEYQGFLKSLSGEALERIEAGAQGAFRADKALRLMREGGDAVCLVAR